MSESPVEHFEHAEHAEHAALLGDPFLTQVAVTIAIVAVIAATVGSLETLETAAAIGDKNAAVLLQNKATDTWNFYQAKSIKKNLYAIAAANGGQQADDFRSGGKRRQERRCAFAKQDNRHVEFLSGKKHQKESLRHRRSERRPKGRRLQKTGGEERRGRTRAF